MKKYLTKIERDAVISKAVERARTLCASHGQLNLGKITAPTAAVMRWKDVKTFKYPGLKITFASRFDPTKDITENLQQLLKLNDSGLLKQYSLIDTPGRARRLARRTPNMRDFRRARALMGVNHDLPRVLGNGFYYITRNHYPDVEIVKEYDEDGMPNFVIIEPDDYDAIYKVRHVKRSVWEKRKKNQSPHKDPPSNDIDHKFLKAPLNDKMLIDALREADKEMMEGMHAGHLRWEEDEEYREDDFHTGFLLVCLFLYVYIMKLHSNVNFYNDKKAFYNYCNKGLGNDKADKLNMKSYNYFWQNIKKLQVRKESLENYIKAKEKFKPQYERGKPNLLFWYEMYRRAARIFERILTPKAIE